MQAQSEYPEDDWLALSGLQHFAFCRRQWALIHVEQQWRDNYLTTAGSLEHDRAHDYGASEARGDLLIMRDLRVFSRRLGITGACDVVEFRQSDAGVPLHGRAGTWSPYPVEYKHGAPKQTDADRLQLCAEAMCLEEMLACSIPEGALFYQQTKHRERVRLDESLRDQIVAMSGEMHDLFARGHTPNVKPSKSCRACSLRDICLPKLAGSRSAKQFIDEQFGLPTVQDIFKELEKPGRDPRGEFKTAVFAEGVEEITDLKPGMILEGTVTNVTNFGAFVDIGVHQDGLVHISSLSDKFVEDPHQVVKTGDIVKVKVLEVDVPRKRIALTMRLDESAVKNDGKSDRTLSAKPRSNAPRQDRHPRGNSAMGNAFADALKNWKK